MLRDKFPEGRHLAVTPEKIRELEQRRGPAGDELGAYEEAVLVVG
jgi:hypothetical protein